MRPRSCCRCRCPGGAGDRRIERALHDVEVAICFIRRRDRDVDRLSLVPVLAAEVGTTRSLRVVPSAISDSRIRAGLEIAEGLLPLASPRAKRAR